jgi:hypothetical protein
MVRFAKTANARLIRSYPKSFTLDASHLPHLTMLQRYVRTAELAIVFAAANKVLMADNAANLKLTALKYSGEEWGNTGLYATVVEVEPTASLHKLQQDLLRAVAPFTVQSGTAAAFFTTPADPNINPPTIDYVSS